jgi:hypothetical protein
MGKEIGIVCLGAIPLPSGEARLSFIWNGDRYRHEWQWRGPEIDAWRCLLTSVEGRAQDPWPSSPAFQTCDVIETPQGNQLAGTGSTGKAFWSFALQQESFSRNSGNFPSAAIPIAAWGIQVACRLPAREVRNPTPWIGSQYRLLGIPMPDLDSGEHGFRIDDQLVLVITIQRGTEEQPPGNTVFSAAANEDRLAISPIVPPELAPHGIATLRWEYQLRVLRVSA